MNFRVDVQHKVSGMPRLDAFNVGEPTKALVSSDAPRRLTVESIGNHVYFYSDVDTDRCLDLIRQVRDIDNMLRHERVSRELPNGHDDVPIWLHINSGGGDGFTGRAVADQFQRIQSPIYTVVEGYCASAATFISMAGKRRYILPSSFMLIHQASAWKFGSYTYTELKDEMKLFEMFMAEVTAFYAQHSKLTEAQLKDMLEHDFWMNAEQALEYGLVDEIR